MTKERRVGIYGKREVYEQSGTFRLAAWMADLEAFDQ